MILPQISDKFQIVDCTAGPADSSHNCAFQDPAFAKNAFILGAVMILLTTTVNLLGVKIISTVNNIGVIAELIGAVGLIIILAVNIQHGPSVLFETDGTGAGHDWGYFGALLLGAIMPLYVMYGFDSAGSLAEETDDPRRTAPKAIWRALLTAGVLGFLLIGFGTMAVDQPATAGWAHVHHEGRARRLLGQPLAGRRRARHLRVLPRHPGDEHSHPVRDGA